MLNSLKILSQYLIPQHAISLAAGKLAESKNAWIKKQFIHRFARAYQIDMSIAENPNLDSYACFNDFFTRAIRMEHRPLETDPNSLCCPVDGAISQLGAIGDGQIIQAKNHQYSVEALLAGNDEWSAAFHNGSFCTIYLAPSDYHRFHMPCDGKLVAMRHVPGQLFSVNPLTASRVPDLFARNERVVAFFDTPFGKLAYVAVGATIVGSIETVWHGTVTPPSRSKMLQKEYAKSEINLARGDEMGRFKLGSTVILLLEGDKWQWNEAFQPGQKVKLGEKLAIRAGA